MSFETTWSTLRISEDISLDLSLRTWGMLKQDEFRITGADNWRAEEVFKIPWVQVISNFLHFLPDQTG